MNFISNYFWPENPYLPTDPNDSEKYAPKWDALETDADLLTKESTPKNSENYKRATYLIKAAIKLENTTTIMNERTSTKNDDFKPSRIATLDKIKEFTPKLINKYDLSVDKTYASYLFKAAKVVVPAACVAFLFANSLGFVSHDNSVWTNTRMTTELRNVTDSAGNVSLQNVTSTITEDTLLGASLNALSTKLMTSIIGGLFIAHSIWNCCFAKR